MSWRLALRARPGSFRGAPFGCLDHEREGARRLQVAEFPLADSYAVEDLGRGQKRHRLRAFVVGEDYMAARDALLAAMEDLAAPGRLVHPWLGELRAWPDSVALREGWDEGGYAAFDLSFLEAAPAARPGPPNRFAQALAALRRVASLARVAFSLATALATRPDLLLRAATSAATGLADELAQKFLGFTVLSPLRLGLAPLGFGAEPAADAPTLAIRTARPFAAIAEAAAAPPAPVASGAPHLGTMGLAATSLASPAGPEPGWAVAPLLALRATSAHPPEFAALVADLAAATAAEAALVTAWTSADAAARARDAVLATLLAREGAAAARRDDALYLALRAARTAALAEFDARLPLLPRATPYRLPAPIPSLALAQLIHGDARRADALAALNNARHPALLPAEGIALLP